MSQTRPIYPFQRGEPITIGRRVLSGDPAGYTVTALLKRTKGQVLPKPDAEVVATFVVEFEPAEGDEPARWLLTIPAEVTADLEPGHYVTDAKFILDGVVVEITGPAFITLQESVSG